MPTAQPKKTPPCHAVQRNHDDTSAPLIPPESGQVSSKLSSSRRHSPDNIDQPSAGTKNSHKCGSCEFRRTATRLRTGSVLFELPVEMLSFIFQAQYHALDSCNLEAKCSASGVGHPGRRRSPAEPSPHRRCLKDDSVTGYVSLLGAL